MLTMLSTRRIEGLQRDAHRFGWTTCDMSAEDIITVQRGVFRTNCLDW